MEQSKIKQADEENNEIILKPQAKKKVFTSVKFKRETPIVVNLKSKEKIENVVQVAPTIPVEEKAGLNPVQTKINRQKLNYLKVQTNDNLSSKSLNRANLLENNSENNSNSEREIVRESNEIRIDSKPSEKSKHSQKTTSLNKNQNGENGESITIAPPSNLKNDSLDKNKLNSKTSVLGKSLYDEKLSKSNSDSLSKSATQKIEDNEYFRAMLLENKEKLERVANKFYKNVQKKIDVVRYISFSGNYDSKNRDVPIYIILPNSFIKRLWDYVVFIALIYSMVMVPLDVGWNVECFTSDNGDLIHVTYLACSIVCFIDIFLTFFTAVLNEKNQYIYSIPSIANNYLSKGFLFDILAAIPFDRIKAFEITDCFQSYIAPAKVFLLFNLVRIFKLGAYISKIEDLLSKHITVVRLVKMIFTLLYLSHFIGNFLSGNSNETTGWIFLPCNNSKTLEQLRECQKKIMTDNFVSVYFYSIYIGMFLLTGNELGLVNAAWERFVCIVIVMLALGLNATIFGNFAVMLGKMSLGLDPFVQAKIDIMKEYMNFMRFDSETIVTIQEYHKNIWMKQRNMMYPEDFFSNLSSALHKLILIDQWKTHFFEVSSFLPLVSEDFFSEMVPILKPKIFMKDDVIVSEGEIATGTIFFIPKGCSCSVKIGGEWVKNMIFGEFFGEIAIFLRSRRRTASITCLKNSDFLCVDGQDFLRLLQDFPEDYDRIKITAIDRLLSHIKLYPSKLFAKLVPKNDLKDYLIRRCIYLNDEEEDAIYESKAAENLTMNLDKIIPLLEFSNNILITAKNRITTVNKKLCQDDSEN
jgi:CRP-like cAMP-binding protein